MSTTPPTRTRYWLTHALLPILAAFLLLLLFEHTRIDRAVLDPFYDPATRKFPLRDSALFTLVFKKGTKALLITFGVTLLLLCFVSLRRPRLAPWRRSILYVLGCLAVAPAVVALFKYSSCKHCPWDLDFYGGPAPYAGLLGCPPPGFGAGECFPSGHASGGFALFALYFALRIPSPSRAWLGFGIAFVYGSVMGFSRMMQGAHFLSHNVATGFTCWFVCLALYELLLRRHDERRFSSASA